MAYIGNVEGDRHQLESSMNWTRLDPLIQEAARAAGLGPDASDIARDELQLGEWEDIETFEAQDQTTLPVLTEGFLDHEKLVNGQWTAVLPLTCPGNDTSLALAALADEYQGQFDKSSMIMDILEVKVRIKALKHTLRVHIYNGRTLNEVIHCAMAVHMMVSGSSAADFGVVRNMKCTRVYEYRCEKAHLCDEALHKETGATITKSGDNMFKFDMGSGYVFVCNNMPAGEDASEPSIVLRCELTDEAGDDAIFKEKLDKVRRVVKATSSQFRSIGRLQELNPGYYTPPTVLNQLQHV